MKRKHPHTPPTITTTAGPTCKVINTGPCTKDGCPPGCPRGVAFVTVKRPPWIVAIHEDELAAWAKRSGVTIIWH